jgi:hypothetical protein
VTASSGSRTVLIADNDLGFVLWLGEVFSELGCQAVPALHSRQALTLAKRLNLRIEALIVNPDLPGAARMVKALTAANPGVSVVFIGNSAAQTSTGGSQAGARLQRPAPWEPISRAEWVVKVRKVLDAGFRGDGDPN